MVVYSVSPWCRNGDSQGCNTLGGGLFPIPQNDSAGVPAMPNRQSALTCVSCTSCAALPGTCSQALTYSGSPTGSQSRMLAPNLPPLGGVGPAWAHAYEWVS